ncbi:MAG: hypothetical protein AABN33_06965 [Acidobacteriota bacterium]
MAEQPTKKQRSVTKTELVWDGKYDKDGKRVAPLRVALPFQTVETVNESAQERQKYLLFESREAYGGELRNRLIWGDKKYVLSSLLPEFAGKYYFQREAMETLIYLFEVAGVRRHKTLVESFATRSDLRLLQYMSSRDTA